MPASAAVLGHDPAPRLVYGDCLYWYEARDQAQVMRGRPYDCDLLRRNCYLIQPSTFWTRALWEKTGGVNEDLHFTMDWEWFLRARSHGRFEWLNQVLSVYRFHPAHKTSGRHGRRGDEILRLIEQHGDPAWLPVFRDVHARLPGLIRTWDRFTLHGRYRLHKLRHWDLYLKHGPKLEEAFFQLHV